MSEKSELGRFGDLDENGNRQVIFFKDQTFGYVDYATEGLEDFIEKNMFTKGIMVEVLTTETTNESLVHITKIKIP